MSKAKRRARYARKLRDELRRRWMREQQEKPQTKTWQVDAIKGMFTFDKA